ncbi:MAG: thermonuclease family protein [Myxococcales bacterium]|nr:thermonuclease family protein [Myxococcales bacterium]
MRTGIPPLFALFLLALALMVAPSPHASASARTRVFLDGQAIPVYMSDGDTFRILEGPYAGTNSRLAGFNALESYGPVHSWGQWHPYELWINAKMATLSGRRGVWHCTTEGERDTYGRLLVHCLDLAVDQIRRGYAHALQIDDTPSAPELLRAQQEAIRARRGMWAHGVPSFVLTSLHSASEDPSRDFHYNRMVSTRDGHSESYRHRETYQECQTVCATEIRADEARVLEVARLLREDPALRPRLGGLSHLLLIEAVDRYARLGMLPEYTEPALAAALGPRLESMRARGELGGTEEVRGACMLYVEFERRYGGQRATCLRDRGAGRPQEAR